MTQLSRNIRLAKAVLFWEALWPALWPVLGLLGLFVLLALAGVFEILPQHFHIAALIVFLLAVGWALRPLFAIRIPDDKAAIRHLEKGSNIRHRPASSYRDQLSTDKADPDSVALWESHKRKMAALISGLKPNWPAPRLDRHDPFALRAALILSLCAAFFLSSGDWQTRLSQSVVPAEQKSKSVWIEAWVSPPPYTGKAPLVLPSKLLNADSLLDDTIEAPEGSELVIRVSQTAEPSLRIATGGKKFEPPADGLGKFAKLSDDTRETKYVLKQSQTINLEAKGTVLAAWRFKVLPDLTPKVELIEPISTSLNNAVEFSFKIFDDYGVVAANTHFKRVGQDKADRKPVAPLKVKSPNFAITLPNTRSKEIKHKVFRDLTAHPWAGLKVELHIQAQDEARQTGLSNKVVFKLPERRFRKPLARAIIEQRRKIVHDTADRFKVTTALNALSLAADDLIKETGTYLALRTAYHRLSRAKTTEEFTEVVDLLWEIALQIEDGDLSFAERELRKAQEALARALANNAPENEIRRLMQNLRQALNKYLRAMAEQARRNPNQQRALNNNTRNLSPLDLNKMLNRLENLARTGARDAAQRLLSQLRNLLENLQAGMRRGGRQGRQQSGMSRMLNGLSGLIAKQQQLMDRTFRQNRGQQGRGQRGQGQPGQGQNGGRLAEDQDALAEALAEINRQLGRAGGKVPSALGRAGKAMRGAAGALRSGEGEKAIPRQGQAIDQLRQGAQALAREMMRRMTQNGNRGRGPARGDLRDPLGRPMRTSGPDYGDTTKVPSEIEVQRAREIMRELQERLGDRARPTLELDYIERLLRRF